MGTLPEIEVTLVRRPLMMLAPAALLVVALALATNVLPLRQIVAQRQEIAATEARLDALVTENDVLDSQVDALGTPIEIERLAREELGYVRPGETAFVVIDPDTDTSEAPVSAPDRSEIGTGAQASTDAERSFVARVWDFVTGRDLATAG